LISSDNCTSTPARRRWQCRQANHPPALKASRAAGRGTSRPAESGWCPRRSG
jgi:hypothetical protein